MQSSDTKTHDVTHAYDELGPQTIIIGRVEELPPGSCQRVDLPEGHELVVYNVGGEFYATSNFCPHKGAPLSEGLLCGNVIECDLHGWQFDVRTGECLTVAERIETYKVAVSDGMVSVKF